jgi:hypothetical protein
MGQCTSQFEKNQIKQNKIGKSRKIKPVSPMFITIVSRPQESFSPSLYLSSPLSSTPSLASAWSILSPSHKQNINYDNSSKWTCLNHNLCKHPKFDKQVENPGQLYELYLTTTRLSNNNTIIKQDKNLKVVERLYL